MNTAQALSSETRYPTRRMYVVKIRGDATRGTFAGRFENVVDGNEREFSSAHELIESMASDLEKTGEV